MNAVLSYPPPAPAKLPPLLRRRFGTSQWDTLLRTTGVVALAAWYPCLRWPEAAVLTGFFCATIFLNGPLSPFFPVAFEPMLMAAGRYYPPLLVAAVAVAGTVYVELLNYHLYGAAVALPRFDRARGSRLVRRTVALFDRSPFFCVWMCAWSPFPFWVVRILAPLSGYPVRRYLTATFLGRMPRLFLFAALGPIVPFSTLILGTITVTTIVAGITVAVHVRMRRRGNVLTGET